MIDGGEYAPYALNPDLGDQLKRAVRAADLVEHVCATLNLAPGEALLMAAILVVDMEQAYAEAEPTAKDCVSAFLDLLVVARAIRDTPPPDELHTCEGCLCTEDNACPGGCGWDRTFMAAGRFVCTRCLPSVQRHDKEKTT